MTGLTTRNALHAYNVKHSGTPRTLKEAGLHGDISEDSQMRVTKGIVIAVGISLCLWMVIGLAYIGWRAWVA